MRTFLTFLMLLCSLSSALAQVKHPRGIELEKALADEVSEYFRRRLPNEPFYLKVNVEPLFRKITGVNPESELPYFDGSSEDVIDEWDQPELSLSFLRARTNKISVHVSVSEKFSDQKVQEIRTEIFDHLKLIPMRDDVQVQKTIIAETSRQNYSDYTFGFVAALGLIVIFLTGSYLVLKKTLKTGASAPAPSSTGMQHQSLPTRMSEKSVASNESSKKKDAHISHDSFRLTEVIRYKIQRIMDSGTFPNLSDVMTFDALSKSKPQVFSTIIKEFPQDVQKNLYQYGLSDSWPQAMNQSPSFDLDSLTVLDRMIQERDFRGASQIWETLLIQVWRMNENAVDFLKKMESEHAYHILQGLPKNYSLKLGRKVFPGGWARVLDRKTETVLIDTAVIEKYFQKTIESMPLCQWSAIKEYRTDEEILTYLDFIGIDEERDIYDTLPGHSFIKTQRLPFFRLFDLEPQAFKDFVDRYPIESLALAMINSSRTYVKKIMDCYDDKQKIVFSSYLKKFDVEGNFSHSQIEAKHEIARSLATLFDKPLKDDVAHENIA